jgi:6-pyruvoyltetrahydropterin/6-carboxytetrahydropterin synthase
VPLTIEKTFRFDAGHRCLGFEASKEETLHGHTWTLRLVVEAPGPLDAFKTVFDTNELARLVQPLVEELDHAFLIWSEDPLREPLAALCREVGIHEKLLVVPFNPTVEGLVEHLYAEVQRRLPPERALLRRAELDATATLRACYSA